MRWPWVRREEMERARQAREDELVRARAEIVSLRRAIERMTDNALHAAGWAPVFEPEAARFQTRPGSAQAAANAGARPLSTSEWLRRIEQMDQEAAERSRRGELAEQLRAIAQERRPASSGGQTATQE